jgi:hypothetical protein
MPLCGATLSHWETRSGRKHLESAAISGWRLGCTGRRQAPVFNDATVRINEINVEMFTGDKAVQAARRVSGVKSVKNDMRIK